MVVWKRLSALTSIGAVIAAAAVYVGGGGAAASSSVSFTSQPTTSTILAHYVVSPAGSGHVAASSTSDDSALAIRWPKGNGPQSLLNNSGGVTSSNSASSPTSSASTPALAHSFIGQQGSNITCPYFATGCNPPDMAIGASPKWVFQGVNMQWEVLDPNGNVQPGWPVSAQNFFGVPNEPNNCDAAHKNQPFMSDPRALYDPADGRFWAAMLQIEGSVAFGIAPSCPFFSVYYVAVSQTSNPNGNWNVYVFNMEKDINGNQFGADYTQLGINSQAVYFSGNMFGEQGGFFAELFEANKRQM